MESWRRTYSWIYRGVAHGVDRYPYIDRFPPQPFNLPAHKEQPDLIRLSQRYSGYRPGATSM